MSSFISLFSKPSHTIAFKTYKSAIITQRSLLLETNIMATGVGNKSFIQADYAILLEGIKIIRELANHNGF